MQTMLALAALVSLSSLIGASEPRFAQYEARRPGMQQRNGTAHGVRQVAAMSEFSEGEEPLPGIHGDPFGNESYPPEMYEQGGAGAYHGGSGCCRGGGCCCGDGCNCYGGDTCYGAEPYYGGAGYSGHANYGGHAPHCADYGPQDNSGMFYAEVQLMALRAHVLEEAVGKLSEKYEFTPRFILGYEAASGLGGRARYWNYGQTIDILDEDDDLRFDFEVVDLEGTSRFCSERIDLLVAGGFRWANIAIAEDDDEVESHMPGLTFAADVRGKICGGRRTGWAGVCGARWSLLGGDWEGDDNDLIEETSDDNVVVQEIYGGIEFVCHHCSCDMYVRTVFEMQNWHSDAMDENSDIDSIGFVGPAVHAGVTF